MIQLKSELDPFLSVCLLHAKHPRSYKKSGILYGPAALHCSFFSSKRKAMILFLYVLFIASCSIFLKSLNQISNSKKEKESI